MTSKEKKEIIYGHKRSIVDLDTRYKGYRSSDGYVDLYNYMDVPMSYEGLGNILENLGINIEESGNISENDILDNLEKNIPRDLKISADIEIKRLVRVLWRSDSEKLQNVADYLGYYSGFFNAIDEYSQ